MADDSVEDAEAEGPDLYNYYNLLAINLSGPGKIFHLLCDLKVEGVVVSSHNYHCLQAVFRKTKNLTCLNFMHAKLQ